MSTYLYNTNKIDIVHYKNEKQTPKVRKSTYTSNDVVFYLNNITKTLKVSKLL